MSSSRGAARVAGEAGAGVAGGAERLPANRKWRAITLATLVLVPAFWALLAGLVAMATGGPAAAAGGPDPAPMLAFGLALVPFVFVALAFLSLHPRAPGAVVRAMGLCLLVGIPVSALAGDAVTGMVAGVGAGGVVALRSEAFESRRPRVWAVALAAGYAFVLVRTVGPLALLPAPVLPLTAIGVADHLAERRRAREAAAS